MVTENKSKNNLELNLWAQFVLNICDKISLL